MGSWAREYWSIEIERWLEQCPSELCPLVPDYYTKGRRSVAHCESPPRIFEARHSMLLIIEAMILMATTLEAIHST